MNNILYILLQNPQNYDILQENPFVLWKYQEQGSFRQAKEADPPMAEFYFLPETQLMRLQIPGSFRVNYMQYQDILLLILQNVFQRYKLYYVFQYQLRFE